ncbi:MAG: synthase subunit delta [Bacillales bacterium]|jgi:F-type H+-transporting ATPase subunit delta|nr:synthase subunit delta [Bacillales bacterium]
MSNRVAAKRYAIALFQLAKEKNLLESLESEARVIGEVFKNEQEAFLVFSNPNLTAVKKKEFITNCLPNLSAELKNLLMILVDRKRESSLLEVIEYFLKLVIAENDQEEAFVYSAKPLTESEEKEISAVFSKKVGKKALRIENIVQPEMLGGLKIRIGNLIFDGSLSGQLSRLHRHILK